MRCFTALGAISTLANALIRRRLRFKLRSCRSLAITRRVLGSLQIHIMAVHRTGSTYPTNRSTSTRRLLSPSSSSVFPSRGVNTRAIRPVVRSRNSRHAESFCMMVYKSQVIESTGYQLPTFNNELTSAIPTIWRDTPTACWSHGTGVRGEIACSVANTVLVPPMRQSPIEILEERRLYVTRVNTSPLNSIGPVSLTRSLSVGQPRYPWND